LCGVLMAAAERINQEGRILGTLPAVTNSILFNTTNADRVVAAMQIFPVTNPWNEDVSRRPLLTNSDAMIAQIGADLLPSRQKLFLFPEMNYVLAPDNQPLVPFEFVAFAEDSDFNGGTPPYGLYPLPTNMPIEGWPTQTSGQTLSQWQTNDDGSDRHSIVVQPGNAKLWESWNAVLIGTNWQAGNGAIFNINSNGLRRDGLTSGDAAGLAMFPALVRVDECERGMVEHACRLVVQRTRYTNYIYPATHYASYPTNSSTNLPSMGQRLRLKANFTIPGSWTKEEKAVLLGLKKYGAFVADNGHFFSFSITPDDRWPTNAFDHIASVGVGITNFEVVQSTGALEGPRSPGAPVASAGADQALPIFQSAQLQGWVGFSGAQPTIHWKAYSGPGTVSFGNATLTNTTASFSVPGVYTLELSADDAVHAVAYDAVVLTVTNAVKLMAAKSGGNLSLSWVGGSPVYVVEQKSAVPGSQWSGVVTTSLQAVSLPFTNFAELFRVRSQ
jgi:hypothetical protein